MNYEKDLFISYAHLDDQPLTPQQQGWVSQFHAYLDKALTWNLGHQPTIWRDRRLTGNEIFPNEITEQLGKVAILVSVLSPCYVESDWCRREIEEFCKAAEQNGKVVVGNKPRIFKVIKRPPKSQEPPLPPFMRDVLGYEFYIDKDGRPLELDPAWPDQIQQFKEKIEYLAYDIGELIERLHGITTSATATSAPRPSIYLGQCSHDRKEDRDLLLADLKRLGYPVFPDKPLPMDDEERFATEVSRLLSQCSLSVHLVGSSYGAIPDGPSQKSVVVLENELAVKRCKSGGLSRIIWLPDGTVPKQLQQQQFIEALGRDREVQYGADLVTNGLEDLKGAIHAILQKLEKAELESAKPTRVEGGQKLIYVISDKSDREASIGLRRWLTSKGLEVRSPVFEGKAATVRKANQETLALCDAAVLFYGVGDEAWKRTVQNDLRKANGYRSDRPPFLSFTYISGPASDDKRDMIELGEPNIINGLQGFSEAAVESLLDAIQEV